MEIKGKYSHHIWNKALLTDDNTNNCSLEAPFTAMINYTRFKNDITINI